MSAAIATVATVGAPAVPAAGVLGDGLVRDVMAFASIPTVSSDPQRAADVARGAAWLAGRLRRAGLEEVAVLPTAGHPVVRAAWRRCPGRPTLLVYGHYDVQPPGRLDSWHVSPFRPERRGEYLYGRGVSDDKGPLLAHVAALEWWLRHTGALPLNVVCLFDGEEEITSPHLPALLDRRPELFAADAAVISDTPMLGPSQPAITYGLRGLLSAKLVVGGPARSLHPGTYGGAVPGAAQALARLLAGLHDAEGRVAVPGFYDCVRGVSPAERTELARGAAADGTLRAVVPSRPAWGEPGFGAHERTTIRPALTVTALAAGRIGPGHLRAIPAAAAAHLDVRLVPDQEPREIARLLQRFVSGGTGQGQAGTAGLRLLSLTPPVLLNRHHPVMAAAAAACRRGFGVPPVFIRTGGTISVVAHLQQRLGMPVALLGLSLPGDRQHGPDERLHLPTFRRGVATLIAFLAEAAERLGA